MVAYNSTTCAILTQPEYYKFEVARPLIKSTKQLYICSISYSFKTRI